MFWSRQKLDIGPLETFLTYEYMIFYPDTATENHANKTLKDFRKSRRRRIHKAFPVITICPDGIYGHMKLVLKHRIHRRGFIVNGYEIRLNFPEFSVTEKQDILGQRGLNRVITLETNQKLPHAMELSSVGKKFTDLIEIPYSLQDIFYGHEITSVTQEKEIKFHSTW